jgi:hypothetical protein
VLRESVACRCLRDEPAQGTQLADSVRRPIGQVGPRHARQVCRGMGSICWRIAAAQRVPQGHPILGRRHEGLIHLRRGREFRERTAGGRQVPCHLVCDRGLSPDSEDREPSR